MYIWYFENRFTQSDFRNGNKINSFGNPDDLGKHAGMCPCGVVGMCKDPSKQCNCDSENPGTDTGNYLPNLKIISQDGNKGEKLQETITLKKQQTLES